MQVEDDITALEMMLSEHQAAPPIYQWTNYWRYKCNMAVEYLQENGLRDYRRLRAPWGTPAHTFASFGAVDHMPPTPPEQIMEVVKRHAAGAPARKISSLPASKFGNPEGFEHNGAFFTLSWLNFYLRYVYVSRFIDLSDKLIVEIGTGSGKQAHLLKMAHPSSTILLFDIPPQLYVANQYLKSTIPDQVVDFKKNRNVSSVNQIEKGKVYLFGNWQVSLLQGKNFDLLWNAASFQEMEPAVVKHYLHLTSGATSVYLMQAMAGQSVAKKVGEHGVIEPTTLETYRSALPKHRMIDQATAHLAVPKMPKIWPYTETFWQESSAEAAPTVGFPDVVNNSSKSVPAELARASTLRLEGKLFEARQVLNEIEPSVSKEPKYLYLSAVVYAQSQEYSQATAQLEKLLEQQPNHAKADILLKTCRLKENNLTDRMVRAAIKEWDVGRAHILAERMHPSPKRDLLLAEVAALQGNGKEARIRAEQASKSPSEALAAVEILEILDTVEGKQKDHLSSQSVRISDTTFKDPVQKLRARYHLQQYVEMERLALQIISENADKKAGAAARVWHLHALYHLGKMSEMVRILESDESYRSTACMALFTKAYMQLGRSFDAIRTYQTIEGRKSNSEFTALLFHITVRKEGVSSAYKLYQNGMIASGLRRSFAARYQNDAVHLCALPNTMVVADGGVGDEIRHAAIYAEMQARSGSLTVTCDPRLQTILTRSFPKLSFLSVVRWREQGRFGRFAERPSIRGNMGIATVMDECSWKEATQAAALGTVSALIASVWPDDRMFSRPRVAHLIPNPTLVEDVRCRLALLRKGAPNKRVVGVSWRSTLSSPGRDLHYTRIEEWHDILRMRDFVFVNLQPRLSSQERSFISNAGIDLTEFSEIDLFEDFERTAALMKALDLVIAPATTMIELAGAVGVSAFFLANTYETSWRMKDDGRDIWHNSVMPIVPRILGRNDLMLDAVRLRLQTLAQDENLLEY